MGYSRTPLNSQEFNHQDKTMEVERINLIGTQLSDLSERTQELRGYL